MLIIKWQLQQNSVCLSFLFSRIIASECKNKHNNNNKNQTNKKDRNKERVREKETKRNTEAKQKTKTRERERERETERERDRDREREREPVCTSKLKTMVISLFLHTLAKGIRQVKDKNVRNTKITFEEVSSNKCNKENTHNSSEIFV